MNSNQKAGNNRRKITETLCKKPPVTGIIWDTEIGGFGLRVGKTAKSFIFNYRIHGRERRMKLDKYPRMSAEAARERVKKYALEVSNGIDPLGRRQAADSASTMAQVWAQYKAEALPTIGERSQEDYALMWEKHIKDEFANRKAHAITKADVIALHRKIAKRYPFRANRVVGLLSVLFNFAKAEMGLQIDNPATGVKKAREEPRERYLTEAETARLLKTLDDFPYLDRHRLPKSEWFEQDGKIMKSRLERRDKPHRGKEQTANAIRLMMLTGCRKGEALSARWEQFDLKAGVWTKPSSHTKQKKTHRVPLSKPAILLLQEIKDKAGKSPFVFPGKTPDTHQEDVKSAWETIRHRAEIPDVRIHDLRHQFASVLVSAGQSLPVIGRLLGHTQAKTTERYSHLFDDPLRKATEAAGAVLSGKPKAAVHDIKQARK